jgi:hypothetical protein
MGTYSGYAGGPATGDISPYPSAGLWGQVDADMNRPGRWMHQWADLEDLPYTAEAIPTTDDPYHGVRIFTSTGGTFTQVDLEGGIRRLSSDGDDEGASVSRGIYPFKIIQNTGELIFEARIRTSTIANTKHGIFVGLIEDVAPTAILPIAAAGTLSDNNLVGFHRLEADGDKLDTVYKANGVTQVSVETDAFTLVADAWTKVGMWFNRLGTNVLEFLVNGVPLATTLAIPSGAGDDFPNDVQLGWIVAVLNATATTPGQTDLDWVRVAQRRVLSATNP